MAAYAHWLAEGKVKYQIEIHAWVFMTNHVHLLLTPSSSDGVSRLMQFLGRQYVQPFNHRYSRTGTLFEGRFRSSLVQTRGYLLNCLRYIELNPVRAGLMSDPGEYHWSSYRAHAFGQPVQMWTPHPEYLALGRTAADRQVAYQNLISDALAVEVVQKIRHCLNRGLVLGNESFRAQVATLRS